MLERARALGIYDTLDHAELVEHLQRTKSRHDLVIAADVFIYIGALDDVFAAVGRVLLPGGRFAFCVESTDDAAGFALQPSLRYAHAAPYLRDQAAKAGFEVERLDAAPRFRPRLCPALHRARDVERQLPRRALGARAHRAARARPRPLVHRLSLIHI